MLQSQTVDKILNTLDFPSDCLLFLVMYWCRVFPLRGIVYIFSGYIGATRPCTSLRFLSLGKNEVREICTTILSHTTAFEYINVSKATI